ncbi:hypothetical protein K8T06_10725 [bacterium]|nr:hypothetical protein [bacterium]
MNRLYKLFRWIARISSILIIGLILFFIIGEGIDQGYSLSDFELRDLILFTLFPVGIIIGYIFAWWREFTGGLIAVLSVALFHIVFFYLEGNWPRGFWFMIFGIPGGLFFLAGLIKPRYSRPSIKFPDE